jgi:hypothetical protein
MHRSILAPAAALLIISCSAVEAKKYTAERYDVQLQLEQPGNLVVTETVRFRFEGGPFTYVYRDIAATETDGIADVRTFIDGQPVEASVTGESPVRVRWEFDAISDQTHTFTVTYRAMGVVRAGDGVQTLAWRALPPARKYRVSESEITLALPPGMNFVQPPALRRRSARFAADASGAQAVRLRNLKDESRVTVTAEFAPGAFAGVPPQWQARSERQRRAFLGGVRAGGLAAIPIAGLALLVVVRLRGSRSAGASPITGLRMTAPPGPMTPAAAAALTGSNHGAAGLLLDLARKGAVRIEETNRKIWGSRDFLVKRQPTRKPLTPHEQTFLSVVFREGETEIPMSKLGSRLHSRWSRVRSTLMAEMQDAGLVDEERRRHRIWLFAGAVVSFAAGGILLAIGVANGLFPDPFVNGLLTAAGAMFLLIAVAALIAGATASIWTDAGAATAQQWRAYSQYVKGVSKGSEQTPGASAVEQLLPYAAAFGAGAALVKLLKKTGSPVPLPGWFGALASVDGADVAAFVAFMSATDSSAGSSAGAGAAAGASGGGGSGAG